MKTLYLLGVSLSFVVTLFNFNYSRWDECLCPELVFGDIEAAAQENGDMVTVYHESNCDYKLIWINIEEKIKRNGHGYIKRKYTKSYSVNYESNCVLLDLIEKVEF